MFFSICRFILYWLFKLFFRFEVSGRQNIAPEGGVIIAANHISLWDPPVIGGAMPRMLSYMAKEELFAIFGFGWLIRKFRAFPVKRGGNDLSAIKNALLILQRGEVLGIFPEGSRSKTGKLGKAEPGVALIIAKTGVPVIPTAVIGADKIFSLKHGLFPKVKVKFGKPLQFSKCKADRQTLDEISGQIMSGISNLLSEEK